MTVRLGNDHAKRGEAMARVVVTKSSKGEAPRDPRLDERVLGLLAEHSGRIAFNGLRRSLAAHPESLSRSLRRLERDGLVVREDGGYALREPVPAGPSDGGSEPSETVRTVATVALPPGFGTEEVLGALVGRWFGRLRWVGIYENPGEPSLVWSVDGHPGHVLLNARRGTLRVAVDRPRDATEATALEEAAQELLVYSLPRIRRSRGERSSVAYFAELPPDWPAEN
jgi:hypothetical protein